MKRRKQRKKPNLPSAELLVELSARIGRLESALDLASNHGDEFKCVEIENTLDKAEEILYDALEALLECGSDGILDSAISRLYAEGKVEAADELTLTIETACTWASAWPDTVYLLPVMLPVEKVGCFSDEIRERLAASWNAQPAMPCSNVCFSEIILTPQEVYAMTYSEIYWFHLAGGPNADDGDATGDQDVPPGGPGAELVGLRFMVIQGDRNENWTVPSGRDADEESDDDAPDDAASANERLLQAWGMEMNDVVSTAFDGPVIFGFPSDFFDARTSGMVLNMTFAARVSLTHQLESRGLFGTETRIFTSMHGDPRIGEEGIVEQIRISLVDNQGNLVAAHIVELNDWFTSDGASDLVVGLLPDFGQGVLHAVDALNDLSEDGDSEPRFYTEAGWVRLSELAPGYPTPNVVH